MYYAIYLLSTTPAPRTVAEARGESFDRCRHEQNTAWAAEAVGRGVALAKQGRIDDALKAL